MKADRHIDIMGIVNLTGDSYYAQSRCSGTVSAVERIAEMFCEGADIIDLGACSTRPGASCVSAEEEWSRLSPVLEEIRREFPGQRFSIDTFRSSVVRKAYDLIGEFIVNDISAGEDDADMLQTVGSLGLEYVAMHKRGTPDIMQSLTYYTDVVGEVVTYFNQFAQKALQFEISDWILDPGFGFAKTIGQNYEMLSRLNEFQVLGRPVLVGVSRKSMIYKSFSVSPEEALPQTQVLHLKALQMGADILRVHDVAEAKRTLVSYRMLE